MMLQVPSVYRVDSGGLIMCAECHADTPGAMPVIGCVRMGRMEIDGTSIVLYTVVVIFMFSVGW